MRKIFLALALTGCLQGGEPRIEGKWYSGIDSHDGCFVTMDFAENGSYASDRMCPGSTNPRAGTYYIQGNEITGADQGGPFKIHYFYEPHGDILWLYWADHKLDMWRDPP